MGQKRSVRACVAGLVFACAVVGMPSRSTHADSALAQIVVGLGAYGVAINPAGSFAYVANSGSGTVSKIKLADDTVTTIAVGLVPYGVAINPAGSFAYVANSGSGTVSKIKLADDTVTTIAVGSSPRGVAINPAGSFAYVTNYGSSSVSKIKLADDTVTTIAVGSSPRGVAINPAGTFAYVANSGSGTVSKIKLADDTVTTIAVGLEPRGVAINPAGTFAYVANYRSSTVSKIKLADDTVTTIAVGLVPENVTINPAGTFAYVTGNGGAVLQKLSLTEEGALVTVLGVMAATSALAINPAGTFAYATSTPINSYVTKIALTATEPQSIMFGSDTQLLGAKTFALSGTASSGLKFSYALASSGLPVTYDSATPTVCTVFGSTVTMLTTGFCIINANQAGGSGWDAASKVSRTFMILPSPPPGEVGVSIEKGNSSVNTKKVTLNLVWPKYAYSARISNDGGFGESKTQTKALAASIDWELDDSVKGVFTKVVYVRFNETIETMKTYSDDIILDTTAPVVETASAAAASGQIKVSLTATDDITGVDKVQIKSETTTVTKNYSKKLSVTQKELGLTVSSSGVKKFASSSVKIRVSDKAGNWSTYQSLSLSGVVATPAVTTPAVTTSKSVTAKSIALYAKIPVTSTSKVSLKVVSGYTKYCKVSGTTLKGVKTGTCKVTVTVTPKKGNKTSRTVTLKVTK